MSRPIPALLMALACTLLAPLVRAEWFHAEQAIMGTSVSVSLWHTDEPIAQRAIEAVMAEMRRVDAQFSPYKNDSELTRINREAAGRPAPVSRELVLIIEKALYFSRLSNGAFDISFASLGRHYDYRQQHQPGHSQRKDLLEAINYRFIDLDPTVPSVAFRHPELHIDLGGIAKGYAVDRAIDKLRSLGIAHAMVSAGGDSRVLGDKLGKPWIVGIKNPRGQVLDGEAGQRFGALVAIRLPLVDAAISTSGDYERYFLDAESGERVHHILNPRTGRSATGVASVSVIGPHSFDTDPLSTALFVMGVSSGLALVNQMPDFEAVFIDATGKVHYSDGLASGE